MFSVQIVQMQMNSITLCSDLPLPLFLPKSLLMILKTLVLDSDTHSKVEQIMVFNIGYVRFLYLGDRMNRVSRLKMTSVTHSFTTEFENPKLSLVSSVCSNGRTLNFRQSPSVYCVFIVFYVRPVVISGSTVLSWLYTNDSTSK